MGIGAGMFIPQVIRWYWWRFNGYGFAVGTIFGMVAAILTKIFSGHIADYNSFLIASGSSLLGCILGTLFSKPTDEKTLLNFYKITRPFGFWNRIRSELDEGIVTEINKENRRDIISIFFAVHRQIKLFLAVMMIVLKQWSNFLILLSIFSFLSIGLYWFWFRHLSKEVKI